MESYMNSLEIRLRSDLRDLSDEEYHEYIESMSLEPDLDLLQGVQKVQRKAAPKKRKVKTYKTVLIKGKRKRIPVGHYVQENTEKDSSIPEGNGSEFLKRILSTSTAIPTYFEQLDDCFEVLVGFTQVGDVVEVDDKWGVVSSISNERFTMLFGCGTLQVLNYNLYEINQNFRIVS